MSSNSFPGCVRDHLPHHHKLYWLRSLSFCVCRYCANYKLLTRTSSFNPPDSLPFTPGEQGYCCLRSEPAPGERRSWSPDLHWSGQYLLLMHH